MTSRGPPRDPTETDSQDAVGDDAAATAGLTPPRPERYQRKEELAKDGQGRVFRATDRELDRDVAIKVPHPGRRPFDQTVRHLASLEHPAIVPVYDVGKQGDASFYAMRLVGDETLADRIAKTPDVEDRILHLVPAVITVADAVAYAHKKGILHCDLKPVNVRLGGDPGEVFVIDWDLALSLTAAGSTRKARGGTRPYSSPEQRSGANVDERSDVYSLGAILHEVLAGEIPGPGSGMPAGVPRALRAIAMRAMSERPEDRHPSASQLALRLREFQAGTRVRDLPLWPWGAIWWIGKHRRLLAALGAALIAATVAVAVFVQRQRAVRRAERERRRVQAARLLEETRAMADIDATESAVRLFQARELADLSQTETAARAWANRRLERVLPVAVPALAVDWSADGRWVAASYDGDVLRVWDATSWATVQDLVWCGVAAEVAFSPDSRWLAAGTVRGEVQFWRLGTDDRWVAAGPALTDSRAPADGGRLVTSIAWEPGSRWCVVGHDNGRALQVSPGDGNLMAIWRHDPHVWGAAVSRDGARVGLAGGEDVTIVDLSSTGKGTRFSIERGAAQTIAFGSDWIVGTSNGTVLVATQRGGLEVYPLGPANVVEMDLVDDQLALGASDGRLHFLQVDDREGSLAHPINTGEEPKALAWSPNGERLAEVGASRIVRIYRPVWRPLPSMDLGIISGIAGSAGHRLAVASDGGVTVFAMHRTDPTSMAAREIDACPDAQANPGSLALSPDGSMLAIGQRGRVRAHRVGAPCEGDATVEALPEGDVTSIAFSPDGRRLAATGPAGRTYLVEDGALRPAPAEDGDAAVHAVAWDPAGDRVVGFARDPARLLVWSPAGARAEPSSIPLGGQVGELPRLAWRPGSSVVAVGADDGRVYGVSLSTGAVVLWSPIADQSKVTSLVWTQDGRHLAVVRMNGKVLILDPDGQTVAEHSSLLPGLFAAAWVGDGTALFAGGIASVMIEHAPAEAIWDDLGAYLDWSRSVSRPPDVDRSGCQRPL